MDRSETEVIAPNSIDEQPSGLSDYVLNNEPSLNSANPSSNTAQDVSHILTDIFKSLYTKKCFDKETTDNLIQSSKGSSGHHKKCITQLKQVQEEYKELFNEYEKVEKHIMQARARAYSADTRNLKRAAGELSAERYAQLGLPAVDTSFRWCVDEKLLTKHHLIVPSQIFPPPRQRGLNAPKECSAPRFLQPTASSQMRFSLEQVDDGYLPKPNSKTIKKTLTQDSRGVEDDGHLSSLSGDSGINLSVSSHESQPGYDVNTFRKNKWRQNMNQHERMEGRKALANLAERHEFLKNPRFLPLTDPRGAKLLTKGQNQYSSYKADRCVFENIPTSNIQYFKSIPEVLTFNQWKVGNVYESVLEFRNESAVSRQIRVLPPKTAYFSLGLGKFPGSQGIVAPGMSAHFCIRFMPDALCDYEDQVEVISQAGTPWQVTVRAQRPPPMLTLTETLQCGHCLVGGIKLTRLPIKNMGGKGRFCLLKKSSWPASNFKTIVNPSALEVGVFQVRPALFDIDSGESTVLELYFSPSRLGVFREEIVMVCDNCQVKTFVIEGCAENASVRLVSVSDGGVSEPRLGEIVDTTANHLIRYEPLNALSFYIKQLVVHNQTNVEIPYTWHVLKPNLSSRPRDLIGQAEDETTKNLDFYPDEESPFVIEPANGVMEPNKQHEFFLSFAPRTVGKHHNVLHLLLSGVPTNDDDENVVLKPPMTAGSNESTTSAARSIKSVERKMSNRSIEYREVIGLEVEVKGECVPYSILLNPPAVLVPGQVLEAHTIRRPLQVLNYSMSPICFHWLMETTNCIVAVDPPVGRVDPGELIELEVKITGSKPGKLETVLKCVVEQMEEPLLLPVEATIKGPEVIIEDSKLDFDLVQHGFPVTQFIVIRNVTQLTANWILSLPDLEDSSEFRISPSRGELLSLQSCEVEVSLYPAVQRSLNTVLKLDVERGASSCIEVFAEVQTPKVCFIESVLQLDETYLRTVKIASAQLLNQTAFPTEFHFGAVTGEQASVCDVQITPNSGMLNPKQMLELKVEILSKIVGDLNQIYLPCIVDGMEEAIILSISTFVHDLKVDFSIDNGGKSVTTCEGLELKFSKPLDIGSTPKVELVMENRTAIYTTWSISMKHFMAPPYFAKSEYRCETSGVKKADRLQLKQTPNLADPDSKTPANVLAEKVHHMLSDGNGLGFHVSSTMGVLMPFETKKIEITVYSNMWGNYKDILTCSVKGIDPVDIPVEVDVRGWPISFKLPAIEGRNPTIRFGSHLNNDPPVQRTVRINNNSPCDIRIDWRTYNHASSDDKQLVDFNIWYGDAFPLRKNTHKPPNRRKTTTTQYQVDRLPSLSDSSDEDDDVRDRKDKALMSSNSAAPADCTCQHSPASSTIDDSAFHSVEDSLQIDEVSDLVHVKLDIHEGDACDIPHEVENKQIIVPSYGEVAITIWLKPSSIQLNKNEKQRSFGSYILGYMSLEQDVKAVDDCIRREDGNSINPVRLEMTSVLRHGIIDVEDDDKEFVLELSDILDEEGGLTENSQIRSFVLRNSTLSTMSFRLKVQHPFFLFKKEEMQETSTIYLPASSNTKIKVGFKVTIDTYNHLIQCRQGKEIKGVRLQSSCEGTESLIYNNSLSINFLNGSSTNHPLEASVFIPEFTLRGPDVEFGKCFIGQPVYRDVVLRNLSPSKCYWSLDEFPQSYDRKLGEFTFKPREGVLPPFISNFDDPTVIISICFVAKRPQPVKSKYIITGKFGEYGQMLRVSGIGSYDGAHEKQ